MTAAFEASILPVTAEISGLTEQVMEFLQAGAVDTRAINHVALALEELLTNLATHGNCADKPTAVRLTIESDRVKAEVVDTGPFFDLRQAAQPDTTSDIADRPIGGLGLFLIREFAKDIGYAQRDGKNVTTFTVARNTLPPAGR